MPHTDKRPETTKPVTDAPGTTQAEGARQLDSVQAAQAIRQQAEDSLRGKLAKQPKKVSPMSADETERVLHELREHQIELELQNVELRRVQVELDATRARYFNLYDMAPVGYCTISEQGLLLEVNLTAANLLGVARGRKAGKQIFSQFIEKEDQDIYYFHRKQLFETGTPQTCELRMIKKGGAAFWAHLSATPAQDEDGTPICRVVISDITDRKKVDERLRKSEEKFRLLYTAMDQGLALHEIITDADGNPVDYIFLDINDSYTRILGVTREMSIGKRIREVMPEVEQYWIDIFGKVALTGEPSYYENYLKTTGKYYSTYSYCPKKNQFAVLVNDITERKKAEKSLRESEELFRSLAESTSDYIMRYDRQCRHTYMNPASMKVSGAVAAEMIGKTHHECGFPEDLCQLWEGLILRVFETTEPEQIEFEWTGADGPAFLDMKFIPEFDTDGNVYSVLGVSRDITHRKQEEKEKARLEAQLQQAQKMESVGRLAGGVAHDFNNMLGVIIGHTEMALEQVDSAQSIHDDLTEILMAAKRSADLTRQLLAFARKQTISPKVLDLNDTVMGMLKMLRRLIGEDIDLAWIPGTALWPVSVDPSQIDQMLANLCINARDAITDVGRITIETGNCTFDDAYCADHPGFTVGDYVQIAVSDTGCGMDKETQSHIFEPFFTTKGMGQGTGLGLSTVYGAVKQNHGFITVYSESGQGTAFTIYLPRHKGEPRPMTMDTPAQPDSPGNETILLVEDEPAILKLTTMMLTRQGYSVLAANTPAEAIRLAREHPGTIHLIMTDVIMPGMNGRDLSRNIQALCPDIKRLFMSGYTANVIAHQGVLEQGVHFIQKPFSKKDLIDKIREVIDNK